MLSSKPQISFREEDKETEEQRDPQFFTGLPDSGGNAYDDFGSACSREVFAPMTTAENKELVRKIFAGLAHGNPHLFVESIAENFRWRISGSSRWSRTFEGKQAVLVDLFGMLRSRIVDRPRTIAEHMIAEGDVVVVQARGDNVSKTGAPYNNNYCFVVRLQGGKLLEITEYCDTDLALRALGVPEA